MHGLHGLQLDMQYGVYNKIQYMHEVFVCAYNYLLNNGSRILRLSKSIKITEVCIHVEMHVSCIIKQNANGSKKQNP